MSVKVLYLTRKDLNPECSHYTIEDIKLWMWEIYFQKSRTTFRKTDVVVYYCTKFNEAIYLKNKAPSQYGIAHLEYVVGMYNRLDNE